MSIFTVTPRQELNHLVHDAMTRMQFADTPELKLLWAGRMNALRRERGDFDEMVEAKRERMDG